MALSGQTDPTKLMNLLMLQLATCSLLQLAPAHLHQNTHKKKQQQQKKINK